jgi:hypothetical protein
MIISERKQREQAAAPNKMKSANKETTLAHLSSNKFLILKRLKNRANKYPKKKPSEREL